MKVEIKPAPRSNPEGRNDMPWNIWKDGVNTNVKPTKEEAEITMNNLLHRATAGPGPLPNREPIKKRHYMDCPRPRGAPKKGSKVEIRINDQPIEAKVSDYLSTQFIVEWEETRTVTKVLSIDDDWTPCV
jgi:hypothetical protein